MDRTAQRLALHFEEGFWPESFASQGKYIFPAWDISVIISVIYSVRSGLFQKQWSCSSELFVFLLDKKQNCSRENENCGTM